MDVPSEKYALITGSASGMGREYACLLAASGYAIVAVDRNEASNCALCDTLRATYGVMAEAVTLDLAEADAADRLLAILGEKAVAIEVLICNAGMLAFGGFASLEKEKVEQLLGLHIATHTRLVHTLGRSMRAQKRGYVLWVSSAAAALPYPSIALYAATKSYVKSLAEALHDEWAQDGVVVTALCPGAVDTPFYELDDVWRKWLLRFGVLLTPREVAYRALRALFKGRKRITPGWAAKAMVLCGGLIPSWMIRRLVRIERVKKLLA